MKRVRLGKTGPQVSRIGLGVWQASADWKGNDQRIVMAIARSHELGINLVDTAEAYGDGHSERVLGRALRTLGRENFVVATKVFGSHLRYDELQRACAYSMRRLGVDYIDIYQVHWPDPWEQIPLKHTMKALEKLYAEGKIRAIAVSNFAVRDLEEARSYLSKTDIISNQVRYNLLQRDVEEEVLPYCRKEGISILVWSPLAQGALTGKYSSRNAPKRDVRKNNIVFDRHNLAQIARLIPVLSRIAQERQCTVAQVALGWLMAQPGVIPIPGAKSATQAEENARAVEVKLSGDDLEGIGKSLRTVKIDYLPKAS